MQEEACRSGPDWGDAGAIQRQSAAAASDEPERRQALSAPDKMTVVVVVDGGEEAGEEARQGDEATPATPARGGGVPSDARGGEASPSPSKEAAAPSEAPTDAREGEDKGCLPSAFGYSQKNFHIADGNLYSILTPFQAKAPPCRPSSSGAQQQDKGDVKGNNSAPAPRTRGRRRAKWKLKFHHQALPPEYLDHYEATMAQEAKAAAAAAAAADAAATSTAATTGVTATSTTAPPPALIRLEKVPETAGPSKGPHTGGGRPSNKGGRRVPNFIQDLQLKDLHAQQQQQVTTATHVNQFKLEPQECSTQPEERVGSSPRLSVKSFPTCETTVSSSLPSTVETTTPQLPEEKRSSVIMASGVTSSRSTEGCSSGSSLRDLPYMGEMTLDAKPRRGRKPKKADICHLIYKNYGTVFSAPSVGHGEPPGTPRSTDTGTAASSPAPSSPSSTASSLSPSSSSGGKVDLAAYRNFSATESLLAKRLTQSQSGIKRCSSLSQDLCSEQDEPLNLCIRDLRRINVSGPFFPVKAEPAEEDKPEALQAKCRAADEEEVADLGAISGTPTMSVVNAAFSGMATPVAGNYIYWPNAGVFVHPMALQSHLLYCQKMGAAAAVTAAPIPIIPHPAAAAAVASVVADKPKPQRSTADRAVASSAVQEAVPVVSLSIPGKSTQNCPDVAASPGLPFGRAVALRPVEVGRVPPPVMHEEVPSVSTGGRKRMVHASNLATKRKRSAIFIPPTAENPTEVSICKFKFTGGAKPSLEEKKMLSVDAGGNFRYYSGTGDKSMRGYEFFPREQTLQQQYMGSTIGSLISGKPPTPSSPCSSSSTPSAMTSSSSPSSSAVLQHFAHGDQAPPRLQGRSQEVPVIQRDQLLPSLPPGSRISGDSLPFHRQSDSLPVAAAAGGDCLVLAGGEGLAVGSQQVPDRKGSSSSAQGPSGARKKRRTRKSLVREKLEQTFREKGFLIQTQQLESAEGATYCKFRQLRKFTRYLFRSWKDYLPGNIKEISSSVGMGSGGQEECEGSVVQPSVEASGVPATCPPRE